MLLLAGAVVHAQGIRFEQGLNWAQVKEKARAEHKFIFVDFFATWCGPCKEMDEKVYPSDNVGAIMNDHFIAVKVQMDSTAHDDEQVRGWYGDAHRMMVQYKVTALPSFFFFSPDGEMVHRSLGFKEVKDFLALAVNAMDPAKQYYTLLGNYQQGRKDFAVMPYLARMAGATGDRELGDQIAADYIAHYLDGLKEDAFFTRENMSFIADFAGDLLSGGQSFKNIYTQRDRADQLLGQKWADRLVAYIITKEEITPALWNGKVAIAEKPDWKRIRDGITAKYNKDYADRTVLDAQIGWYDGRKDWAMDVKYNVAKIDKYGVDTSGWGCFGVNNLVFNLIFQHSNDKVVLKKAAGWMALVVSTDTNSSTHIDTYANVLYKAGKVKEAISWEEKATRLDAEAALKQNRAPDKLYQETVDRMKKGLPTWGQQYNM